MIGRIGRRDLIALAALCLAAVGIPLALSAAAGTIGIPSNDDWVYMRAAGSLFRTGTIDMPGHTTAFIGQLLMAQPLLWLSGGDLWAFTAFGLIMALIGVASTYLLARRFVGTGSAVMVGLLMVVFPGFARETATFMTDGPAYALVMLCLLLGVRWLQGDGGRSTLIASLVVGLLGVSIREFALAAPAAILVAAWARNRADERVWLAGMTAAMVVGTVGVLAIAGSFAGPASLGRPSLLRLARLGPAFVTLSAVLLPAAALAVGRRMATISPQQVLGAGLACLLAVSAAAPLVGNIWAAGGLAGNALLSGARHPVIGAHMWGLSQQLALFAAILVASLAVRWGQRNLNGVSTVPAAWERGLRIARSLEAPLFLFLFAYAAGLLSYAMFGLTFDRYLYPMVPAAAILLLRGIAHPFGRGRSHAFARGALVWLALSSFVITANSFAYDAARWRAGEAAVAMGYDARTVDAGLEWVGYHAAGVGIANLGSYGVTSYDNRLMSVPPCAVVSNSPLDVRSFTLIRLDPLAYRQYLFFGAQEPLYLYGALTDGCPRPPAATANLPDPRRAAPLPAADTLR